MTHAPGATTADLIRQVGEQPEQNINQFLGRQPVLVGHMHEPPQHRSIRVARVEQGERGVQGRVAHVAAGIVGDLHPVVAGRQPARQRRGMPATAQLGWS